MSKQIQIRRGTAAQHATFVGAVAEMTYSTDDRTLRVHDGTTAGGGVVGVAAGSDAWLKLYAKLPDALLEGAIDHDTAGVPTTAAVIWPDGTPGVYTTLATSSAGAVDSYRFTYLGAVVRTATQPTMTRNPTTGAVSNRPPIIIS